MVKSFEFTVMPFGLIDNPKAMDIMDIVLDPEAIPFCCVYLDNIIEASSIFEVDLKFFKEDFQRLEKQDSQEIYRNVNFVVLQSNLQVL